MSRPRTVVLDNEAVQALLDPKHRKHRRVLSSVESVASRNLTRAGSVALIVPATVRVEAGWDRRKARAAAINRVRAKDWPLDSEAADVAADVRVNTGVSVPDAHIAATIAATPGPHAVLTSDVDDLRTLRTYLGASVNIVRV